MNALIFLLLFFPSLAFSQEVLIKSLGSSPLQYQIFLNENKKFISFIDYNHAKLQRNPTQEEALFQLSELFHHEPKLVVEEIKKIQAQGPLTLISLRFIRDLSDKLLNEKIKADLKKDILGIYCKTISILNEGPALHPCVYDTVSASLLHKRFPQIEKIAIEGLVFDFQDNLVLGSNNPYQWTLLSNSHKAVRFYGTFSQLLNQHFVFESLAEGSCEQHSLPTDLDFEIMETSTVFFAKDCLVKTSLANKKSSSLIAKKSLLYVTGIAVLTGIIYSMKDKTVVIDAPALK
ncbi:hypothetical protein [Bdellovibrio reynosensis]|uniref:Uncharacterized protein n=1 Tax=Bdellovibrio reynosensis TaxID=2835041 RepID=A0ABY4C7R9_9BACT|nr:hypothetical protein [Bdellovibrio reynosensis]UOF00960.1 hypothetical protein MNR06_14760 [Bdellovibrio reynosensis]